MKIEQKIMEMEFSSRGFGKTAALLKIAEEIASTRQNVIFVTATRGFAEQLYKMAGNPNVVFRSISEMPVVGMHALPLWDNSVICKVCEELASRAQEIERLNKELAKLKDFARRVLEVGK